MRYGFNHQNDFDVFVLIWSQQITPQHQNSIVNLRHSKESDNQHLAVAYEWWIHTLKAQIEHLPQSFISILSGPASLQSRPVKVQIIFSQNTS